MCSFSKGFLLKGWWWQRTTVTNSKSHAVYFAVVIANTVAEEEEEEEAADLKGKEAGAGKGTNRNQMGAASLASTLSSAI